MASELTKDRRELPWVRIEKTYTLDTDQGPKTLKDLFDGRSQLLVYHIMFNPDWTAACPGCTHLVDHFDPMLPHLDARDVRLVCVSHAPLEKLQAYKRRMGWRVPYASSFQRDFNRDFGASLDADQSREVAELYLADFEKDPAMQEAAKSCGTDVRGYITTEAPGLDAFALEPDGTIYHTFTSVPYGDLDIGYQQYLDHAPREWKGTIPTRRRDEYGNPSEA